MDCTERKTFVEETLKSLVLATELKYWVADLTFYRRNGREGITVTYIDGKTRRIQCVQGVQLCQLATMVFAEAKWMYVDNSDYYCNKLCPPTDDEHRSWNMVGTRLTDKVKLRSTYLFNDEKIIVDREVLVCQGCNELEAYIAKEFTEVAVEYIQGKLKFIDDYNRGTGDYADINVYNRSRELIYRCSKDELEGHLISVEVVAS